MKTVYACFTTDVIHEGHLNIINEAKKIGRVVVGVLTDEEMIKFDRFPTVSYDERMQRIREIEGVDLVVKQDQIMYDKVIDEIHPDYVIHGDNWLKGPTRIIRDHVEKALLKYGGKIIDIPYTCNENVSYIDAKIRDKLSMPEFRRKRLRQLLNIRTLIKALEVHNGITGLIVEKTVVEHGDSLDQFDAMWISSLCDSTAKGKPDIELVDMTSRFKTIDEITEVTTKPIIFDGDTGGLIEHFVYTVRTLERVGVSAIIIEDKIGLKRNSLFGNEVLQTQDTIEHFCEKIRAGKEAQLTDDFMIIARIESLILEKGLKDALERAFACVSAGADGIMIHSRSQNAEEVFAFCDAFREKDEETPLVVVPTTYSDTTESELAEHGVNIVIYANHLMRSACMAMEHTATEILKNHRAKEAEQSLMPIKEIISLIDLI